MNGVGELTAANNQPPSAPHRAVYTVHRRGQLDATCKAGLSHPALFFLGVSHTLVTPDTARGGKDVDEGGRMGNASGPFPGGTLQPLQRCLGCIEPSGCRRICSKPRGGFFSLSLCSFPARAGGRTEGVCEVRSVLTLPWGVCWSCSSGVLITRRVDEGRGRGCLCGSWCGS